MAVQAVPGSYGWPLLGSIMDRLSFYVLHGEVNYFKRRMQREQSSVVRIRFMPATFPFPDSRGIALLCHKSFPTLFDTDKVEKRDVFVGSYAPSTSFTGGIRPLAYLDSTEPRHEQLKRFVLAAMASKARVIEPSLKAAFSSWMDKFEAEQEHETSSKGIASYLETMLFDYMSSVLLQRDALQKLDAKDGVAMLKKWIIFQFAPIASPGSTPLPSLLEDLLLRSFPFPFVLASSDYSKLVAYISSGASSLLSLAESEFGIPKHEALHNLVFLFGVNAWLGLSKLLPRILFYVTSAGPDLHRRLASEVNGINGGADRAVNGMPLLESTVLEVLRMAPPAQFQYGRARTDFVVEGVSGSYAIRKGELLGASQLVVCRDPAVFHKPDEFVPDRFVGQDGYKLAAFVFWSNGPHTSQPDGNNKQCGGKDLVFLTGKLFLTEWVRRYEPAQLAEGSSPDKPILKPLQCRKAEAELASA